MADALLAGQMDVHVVAVHISSFCPFLKAMIMFFFQTGMDIAYVSLQVHRVQPRGNAVLVNVILCT